MYSQRGGFCRLVLFLALFGCGEAAEPQSETAESTELLRSYVAVDTRNPNPGEGAGAEFLRDELNRRGVEAELHGPIGRESVVARLDSGRDAPGLLIHHHIDTVDVEQEPTREMPGYLKGAGVLDTKSLGIAHLEAFSSLVSHPCTLGRDVLLVGVADEEMGGGSGMAWLLENRPELFAGIGWAIGEGGGNVTVIDEQQWWGIEVDHKAPLWIRLETTGGGGHGANAGDSAVTALVDLLQEIVALQGPSISPTPEVTAYLRSLAATKRTPLRRELLRASEPGSTRPIPGAQADLLRTTVTVTSLSAGTGAPNVVPSTAAAIIDVRLPPGVGSAPFLEEMRKLVGDRATLEVLLQDPEPPPPSPMEGELWSRLRSAIESTSPAPVGPLVGEGFSDNRHLRRHGIRAYGFSPFKLNYYDGSTIHTSKERMKESFFIEGVDTMKKVLRELACSSSSSGE